MLARICLVQSRSQKAPTPVDQRLGERVLQNYAMLCVESSYKLVVLVCGSYRSDVSIGILPWRYRIFYLYVASHILLAAMLRPELLAPVALESWSMAMLALGADEYLGLSSNHPGRDQATPADGSSEVCFQDSFHT